MKSDEETLTPNHFLVQTLNGMQQPVLSTEVDLCLQSNWCRSHIIENTFWKNWQCKVALIFGDLIKNIILWSYLKSEHEHYKRDLQIQLSRVISS